MCTYIYAKFSTDTKMFLNQKKMLKGEFFVGKSLQRLVFSHWLTNTRTPFVSVINCCV